MRRFRVLRSCGTKCGSKVRTSGNPVGKRWGAIELLECRTLLSGLAWTPGPSLPIARADAAAVSTYSSVLLVGGAVASGNSSASLDLDLTSGAWTTAATLNSARVSPGIGETGKPGPIVGGSDGGDLKYSSDIFVFGGASTTTGQPSAATTNYDPANANNSTAAPPMATARSSFAYVTDPATGDLYAIGGQGASSTTLASAEMYDPVADAWSAIAPLPAARSGATAAADGVGHLYVFGGVDSAGNPSS